MILKPWMFPFLLALGGVILDFTTAMIGLNFFTGLYETHLQYNPVRALTIFWIAIGILTLTLPRKKPWSLSVNGLALMSYIGAINNTLVILGLFSGLVI